MLNLIFMLLVFTSSAFASGPLLEEARRKNLSLSEKEQHTLEIGEISAGRQVSGGLLGIYPGFGIGHAAQGRWHDRGWRFTASELGAIGVMLASGPCLGKILRNDDNNCTGPNEVLLLGGLFTFIGIRVWEIFDVWSVPPKQNRRWNQLKKRIQEAQEPTASASVTLVPIAHPRWGTGLGLVAEF